MVLDPFSALSLASNIVQFVDYGGRLVSKSVELYKSAIGEATENIDLESVAQRLQLIAGELEDSTVVGDWKGKSQDEDALRQLALSAQKAANELISMINDLKVDPKASGLPKSIQSLRQAFRHIGMENRLEAFEKKLDRYRSEMTLHVVNTLR